MIPRRKPAVFDGILHVPVVSPDRPVDDGLADFMPLLDIEQALLDSEE